MAVINRNKKIFLIEDDQIDIMVFKRAMKKLDITHSLQVFYNGEEFLEALKTQNEYPDILFIDLNTPRMNGVELLKTLVSVRENFFFPVIVITTSNEDNDIVQAYRYYANGYITKSISFYDFAETLNIVFKYWSIVQLPKGVTNE